jgi:hypothetical protein
MDRRRAEGGLWNSPRAEERHGQAGQTRRRRGVDTVGMRDGVLYGGTEDTERTRGLLGRDDLARREEPSSSALGPLYLCGEIQPHTAVHTTAPLAARRPTLDSDESQLREVAAPPADTCPRSRAPSTGSRDATCTTDGAFDRDEPPTLRAMTDRTVRGRERTTYGTDKNTRSIDQTPRSSLNRR